MDRSESERMLRELGELIVNGRTRRRFAEDPDETLRKAGIEGVPRPVLNSLKRMTLEELTALAHLWRSLERSDLLGEGRVMNHWPV